MTQRFPMNYAIVRYAPFVETREFANIGIVLVSSRQGYFDFKLQRTQKHSRVSQFFQPAPVELFKKALVTLREDLQRMKRGLRPFDGVQPHLDFGGRDPLRLTFLDLQRRKEGVVRFSDESQILAEDPMKTLDSLFGRFVDRDFATPVYRERLLENVVREALKGGGLERKFTSLKLGDELYQASFPFVRRERDKVTKVIKPFFLGQERPESIIDHSVRWAFKVKRLKDQNVLPDRILFPVEGPTTPGNCMAAFLEARAILEDAGVTIADASHPQEIVSYAAS